MIEIRRRGTGEVLVTLDQPSLRGARLDGSALAGADFGQANRLGERLLDAPSAFTWWIPLLPIGPAMWLRDRGEPNGRWGRMRRRAAFLLGLASMPFGFLLCALMTVAALPLIMLEPVREKGRRAQSRLVDADLCDADLRGADLRGATLVQVMLREADLAGADLSATRLLGRVVHRTTVLDTDGRGCNLAGADLSGAHLGRTDLSGASLRGAVLRGAVLTDVDLRGVNISGADLRRAAIVLSKMDSTTVYDAATLWPRGFDPVAHGVAPQ